MDISSMLEVQVKEMKMEMNVKENGEHNTEMTARIRDFHSSSNNSVVRSSNLPTYKTDNVSVTPGRAVSTINTTAATISQEENAFYKLLFNDIASVRFYRIHCTGCNIHIGSAPAQIHNMFEHPVLHTLLCARCREFYGDGTFEQGDDATDMFCRWCANGGNLYCCSYCSNTFCYKCIKRNFSSLVRKKIEADEKWKCFVCNPRDLYTARAMCWALLQHVQTVTRILKNDKKMSAKEIEEKMNLDESQCCTRRSKRRYRRVESNSEEEDETYIPNSNGLSMNMKRKMKKFKSTEHPNCPTANDTKMKQMLSHSKAPIPIRPRPTLSMSIQTFKQVDSSQSKIEHEKQIVKPSENLILPSSSMIKTDISKFSDSNVLQSSCFYHTFMNSAGSSTYVQVPPVVAKPTTHQITLPSLASQQTSYQSSHLPQPQPPLNAMVSIPNPVRKRGRPRLFSRSKRSDLILTPNIIEIDSDSNDEPEVIEQQDDSIINVDIINVCPDKVVPIALTWGNNEDNVKKEQSLRQMCASVEKSIPSFNEVMLPHKQELDKILCDVKEKVCLFFNLPNVTQDIELAAQQKIKHFYRYMHNTVLQLTHIHDRVIREYNGWTKSRRINTDALSSINKNTSVIQENVEIPLDMICVSDSEADSDCEKSKYQIKIPSDIVINNNIIKDLFSKKDIVHRDVGNDAILCANKAIQVCDIAPCDYEKHIGYSILDTAEYDLEKNDHDDNDIPDVPRVEPQNFGKYEEQFIYYLQHIEDHGIETEDAQELTSSNEISSQEITSSFLSLHRDIDSYISTNEQMKNSGQETNTKNCVNSLLKDNEIDVLTNAISKDEITNKSNIYSKTMKKKSQETKKHSIGNEISIISNKNDASSSQNSKTAVSTEMASLTENEDCAIIED